MAIPQMRGLFTIWLKMSHFIISVSDQGKCGTKLKLSTVEVHSRVIWELSVVSMATVD